MSNRGPRDLGSNLCSFAHHQRLTESRVEPGSPERVWATGVPEDVAVRVCVLPGAVLEAGHRGASQRGPTKSTALLDGFIVATSQRSTRAPGTRGELER